MERNKKIFMQSWLRPHPRVKSVSTDEWYLDFANRLSSLIGSSQPYIGKRTTKYNWMPQKPNTNR